MQAQGGKAAVFAMFPFFNLFIQTFMALNLIALYHRKDSGVKDGSLCIPALPCFPCLFMLQ